MRNLLQTKVGLRIKDLRAAAGLSQERFALKIGMDRTYLASIEAVSYTHLDVYKRQVHRR